MCRHSTLKWWKLRASFWKLNISCTVFWFWHASSYFLVLDLIVLHVLLGFLPAYARLWNARVSVCFWPVKSPVFRGWGQSMEVWGRVPNTVQGQNPDGGSGEPSRPEAEAFLSIGPMSYHHHHIYFPIITQNKNHKNSHTIGGLPEKPYSSLTGRPSKQEAKLSLV